MQVGKAAGVSSTQVQTPRYVAKRLVDAVGAALLLVLLSPMLLLIAVAVRIDSKGPALFIQDRVGAKLARRDGRKDWIRSDFSVYKFRSMYADADDDSHREYIREFVNGEAAENEEGPRFKLVGDPRVTRVGRIIRRTSADELPQLLNVLLGDMSLVGPRPVPPYEVDEYSRWHLERFNALPGITGYWQVHGRGSVPFEEMMRMDIYYVRNQSFWLDIKLLAQTLPAVVSAKGAR
jgi:lipopolysaccharide/colanic/teichoic acid biosynthesis glycosyltransferase